MCLWPEKTTVLYSFSKLMYIQVHSPYKKPQAIQIIQGLCVLVIKIMQIIIEIISPPVTDILLSILLRQYWLNSDFQQ